jgi:hypothetical protein
MMARYVNVVTGCAVLVLALGLLFPTIIHLRERAACEKCRTNLLQIGHGLGHYESFNGAFPLAAIPNEELPISRRLSWIVEIQNLTEQLYILIDRKKAWDDENNMNLRWISIPGPDELTAHPEDLGAWKLLLCPSNPEQLWGTELGLTHYVGITGVGEDAGLLPQDNLRSGVFGFTRQTRIEDVSRGASATMMVIETCTDNGPWTAAPAAVRHLEPANLPYLGSSGQFNSHHPFGNALVAYREAYGTNVVFVDGSIRTLTNDIDPKVFEAMATITGGKRDWLDSPEAADGEVR